MAHSSWPEHKASVILLPSGEQGEAVLEVAREWTRMGLIGPALWVRPERVRRLVSGPPRIGATIVALDADHQLREVEVDLFESLAREHLARVRLVKLRSAVPSREVDAEQDEIAGHVGDYLTKAMPMAVPRANIVDQVTDLVRLTLICAPTEFQLQQRVDWAASEYGIVVIASPEDRASPWSGDAFVRDNQRFVGFAMMHLASVAGLWSGMNAGTFELIPSEASNQQSVWVSRVFLNAIITEALGRRTAAQVLDLVAQADSLIIDPSAGSPPAGTAFIEDEMVAAYIAQMVDASMRLDQESLSFHPSSAEEMPDQGRWGIKDQLRSFGSFGVDKVAAMPRWTRRWFTSRTERALTSKLQTADGTHVVGSDYDSILDARDALLIARRDGIFESERAARAAMAAPVSVSTLRTTPRLWARLRELVFGSLDGSSDLSELGFAPIEQKVPVFGRVSDVFPSPDDVWSVDDGPADLSLPIDWNTLANGDPRGQLIEWMDSGRQHAARAVDEAEHAEAAYLVASVVPEPEPEPEDEQVAAAEPDTEPEPAEEPEPEAEPDAEPAPETETANEVVYTSLPGVTDAQAEVEREQMRQRRDQAKSAAEAAEAERQRREEAVRSYDSWAVSKDRSFAWRLFNRLAADRHAARDAVNYYAREVDRLQIPAPGELIKLRKAFHRSTLVTWMIVAAVAALIILLPLWFSELRPRAERAGLWYPEDWMTVLIAVGVGAILTTVWLAAYHRGWSSFQRQVDLTHAHLAFVATASRNARRELSRLRSLHQQTVDWLDLLARAVHKPWRIRPEWQTKPDYDVARDSLPFAMSVGTVVESDYSSATRLRRMTTEHLVRRGWRAEAFEDLVRAVGAELGQDAAAFGVGALDEDLPHSSNNTRRMLRDGMSRDAVLTRVAAPRLRSLMQEIQRSALHGSKPPVESIQDNPLDVLAAMRDSIAPDEGIAWDEFLVDSLAGRREPVTPLSTSWMSQRQIQDGHHEQVTSYLVLPDRLRSALDFNEDAPITMVPFHGAGLAAIDLVWRSDVVGPVPVGAVGLWHGEHSQATEQADLHDGDSGV